MSPDWSASPEPVPYVDLSDPQTLNLYSYVRNNPMSRADADGHDFEQAWEKLKEGLNGVTVKVRIGIGVGAKVRAGAVQGKVEAAVKATVQFSEKGKLSVSESAEAGATAGVGKTQVGLGVTAEQVKGSVDLNTGEKGGPEPATGETVVGVSRGESSASGNDGSLSIGYEEGEGPLAGGEIGITKEGMDSLKDAFSNVKETLFPQPPPTPPPPGPPQLPTDPKSN